MGTCSMCADNRTGLLPARFSNNLDLIKECSADSVSTSDGKGKLRNPTATADGKTSTSDEIKTSTSTPRYGDQVDVKTEGSRIVHKKTDSELIEEMLYSDDSHDSFTSEYEQ